jgi:hypothetical protein
LRRESSIVLRTIVATNDSVHETSSLEKSHRAKNAGQTAD